MSTSAAEAIAADAAERGERIAVFADYDVDGGAAAALGRGKSLLPAGVTGIEGEFNRGDLVLILGPDRRELGRGLIVLPRPARTAIERHIGAAVIRIDHVQVVARIDPVIVMVAVRGVDFLPGLATVYGFHERHVQHPHRVLVGRIGGDVVVIPGASV